HLGAAALPVPQAGDRYCDEKGSLYRVVELTAIGPALEPAVLYRPIDPRAVDRLSVEPLSQFLGPAQTASCAAADSGSRFHRLERPTSEGLDSGLPESLIPLALRQGVLARYDERQRFYHDRSHVLELFECAR